MDAMRWRAFVVVKLSFSEPRTGDSIKLGLRAALCPRFRRVRLRVDPTGSPQFAHLILHGTSSSGFEAGSEIRAALADAAALMGATTAEVRLCQVLRRSRPWRRRRVVAATGGPGGPGGGGSTGLAGVREPRRPGPGNLPPMQAERDVPRGG